MAGAPSRSASAWRATQTRRLWSESLPPDLFSAETGDGATPELAEQLTGTIPQRKGADHERGVDAQMTTQLDAGIGARDVEETGTIQGANLHVLDRLGDGKIG